MGLINKTMNKEQLYLEIDKIYSEYHGFDLGLLDEKSEKLIKEAIEKLLNIHSVVNFKN